MLVHVNIDNPVSGTVPHIFVKIIGKSIFQLNLQLSNSCFAIRDTDDMMTRHDYAINQIKLNNESCDCFINTPGLIITLFSVCGPRV